MRKIAAVLFEDFEMLDLYGPLEIFSTHRDAYQIVTVAETTGPVRASGGPATLAERSFAQDVEQGSDRGFDYDLLLVPGGRGVRTQIDNPSLLSWLSQAVGVAELTTSVCTGSLLLAKAGVLNGHRATTNKNAFDWVVGQAPDVNWQRQARWVEDGAFFTSSGVSAGIDMALAVTEHLLGAQAAQDAADIAEHVRNADPRNDPFAAISGARA